MPPGLSFAANLLLAISCAQTLGLCSALLSSGLRVNCSSLDLEELPRLPPDTTELHVRDNRLTSVPPGLFDGLAGLRRVSLSGNPFHCDCKIKYLRNWLLRNRAVVSKEPTCASPSAVARKAIAELGEDYFSSCAVPSCADAAYSAVVGAMTCGLVALLLWSLRLAKASTFTLAIDERHTGFEASSLRSLKPKHRRRLHAALSEASGGSDTLTDAEALERPLINMELLPQVLDVLHKKHNIKIKAT